jgi:hypothetical protein
VPKLKTLVKDMTGGSPMGGCKYVRRSLKHLSRDLDQHGHQASPNTVARLLRDQDFSLKANIKRLTGGPCPGRDQQFRHIQRQRKWFARRGLPVVSIDAKKKELVGNFKNPGRAWVRESEPVNTYDFIHQSLCRATPYGLLDPRRNRALVCVGTSADTAEFAVDCLDQWWCRQGQQAYRPSKELLVLADGGGSNGHRPRLFKRSLQQWVDRHGIAVTVCHYPTGASKWNPVEHRLFSQISINWAAQPLRTLDTMLACIRGTTTDTGLRVESMLMNKDYPRKVKVSDAEMRALNIQRHTARPEWNYTIRPRSPVSLT